MRQYGWQGRPLLVEHLSRARGEGHHYMASTGTHRLAAAKAAGLVLIPVVFVRGGKPARKYPLASYTSTDPHRLAVYRARRERLAAAMMREEIRINAAANRRGVL
jgi:hypothetical protein